MAQFCTPEELGLFMGETGADAARLDQMASLASAAVQSYTHQQIEMITDDTLVMRGTWDRELFLPQRPVVQIHSLTVGPYLLDPAVYTLTPPDRVIWAPELVLTEYDLALSWSGPYVKITVVYDHGYDPIPDAVKLATMRIGARMFKGQVADIVEERIGQYTILQRGMIAALELVEGEKNLLREFMRQHRSADLAT